MKRLISKEFIIYCLVGLINTFVGISTAFICLNICLWTYSVSTGLAYFAGIIVSFFLNKKYTFRSSGKSGIQFLKFFTTMLPAYIISYWLGFEFAHFCSKFAAKTLDFLSIFTAIPQNRLVDNFAVIVSMAIYLVAGFSINKFIVFKNKNNEQ